MVLPFLFLFLFPLQVVTISTATTASNPIRCVQDYLLLPFVGPQLCSWHLAALRITITPLSCAF